MAKDPFALIATERRALADLVDGLDEEQLATPSLCGGLDDEGCRHRLLALVISGRQAGLEALSGPGRESLATWVG